MPQMSPASRPTLSLSLTPTPTSSKFGWRRTSGMIIFPTNPVPQTTTFFLSAMGASSHPRRDGLRTGSVLFRDGGPVRRVVASAVERSHFPHTHIADRSHLGVKLASKRREGGRHAPLGA